MGLDNFISIPHQAYCYDFVSEWLHSEDVAQLYPVARFVESETHLPQRFAKLSVSDLADTECFPCVNEIILTKIMGRKTVGLVGLWDCVAFDEVAGIHFKDNDGVQIM